MRWQLSTAPAALPRADLAYDPCLIGIHVCGATADGLEPVTVANFPTPSIAKARKVFERARQELGNLPADEADLIVDLMELGDCEVDFGIHRQDLRRLEEIVRACA